MKKTYAVLTAFVALMISAVFIGKAETQESQKSAEGAGDRQVAKSGSVSLDFAARREQIRAEEQDYKSRGWQKTLGGWIPMLRPDAVFKGGAFPPFAPELVAPGHLGNQLTYLNQAERQHPAVEEALKSSTAPRERLQYFHELLESPDVRLDGWHLHVRAVTVSNGAKLVTIYANPLVSSDLLGPAVAVNGAFEETYELKDGELKLVKTAPVGHAPVTGLYSM